MSDMQAILERLAPAAALAELAAALKKIMPLVTEEERLDFLVKLVGGAGDDKVASMVHLWLAECLDEGVDPTHMCQRLVNRVAQSRDLSAVADPELVTLFEDWLDELEAEVVSLAGRQEKLTPEGLAAELGLSRRGAAFLLSKLQREGKLP